VSEGISSTLVSWEAEYWDGTILAERRGARYEMLDRDNLRLFRFVAPGEILVELRLKSGQSGHSLAYRRRTIVTNGVPEVWFLVASMPNGPVLAYQPETTQLLRAPNFVSGSGPLGQIKPRKQERWTTLAHNVDAMVAAKKILLPSGYVLNV
jgi:hypothetical protein